MRLLLFVPVVILRLGVWGCSKTPQRDIELMNRAEELMETAPDSSLAIMESVDSDAVRGRADRARYALLMSMALDRNIIELKDFNVLQPAIDYYPKHGTPDERLKTRYYEGRIHMNRGDDDAAMTAFLQAEEDTAIATHALSLALLHRGLAHFYFEQYNHGKQIEHLEKAVKFYRNCGHEEDEFVCYRYLLNSANLKDDKSYALTILNICDSICNQHPSDSRFDYTPEKIIAYLTFKNKSEVSSLLDSLKRKNDLSDESKLDIAMSLSDAGENEEAIKFLQMVNQHQFPDSLKYLSVKAELLDKADLKSEALDAYKNFVKGYEIELNNLINSKLLFTEEKYNIQVENLNNLVQKDRIILIILICGFILALVTIMLVFAQVLQLSKDETQRKKKRFLTRSC